MSSFIINGGKKLKGTVKVDGSKNASLPIISACLLTDKPSTLTNVPNIADIHTLLSILEFLGAKTEYKNKTLKINPKNLKKKKIPHKLVSRIRASILLLAPLLARFGEVKLSFPGGCVIGKRPIDSHLHAFEYLGAKIIDDKEIIHLKANQLVGKNFSMAEMSVTATENAVMTACLAKGKTTIRLAAAEPHVQDLCHALNKAGAKISGIGTHTLKIIGVKKIRGLRHKITSDYIEVGTLAIASAVTKGHVIIKNAQENHLDSFWQKMKEVGVKFEHRKNEVEIFPSPNLKSANIRTAVFPSFPTDLQAQFAVLLTQGKGTSRIFESLFDGKMNYIFELEKMGAHIAYINNREAMIFGKTKLSGCPVASLDIRAGAAMVLAALAASGTTEVSQINYIDRGYSNLVKKLKSLGADIKRVD